jgi:threonine/homoserine/homoserine lactone efflux protein
MMTAIAYTPGPMTMFSSLRHGFFRTLPGIFGGSLAYMVQMAVAYALFGARIFGWLEQRHLEKLQTRVTAGILFTTGGLLAVSHK